MRTFWIADPTPSPHRRTRLEWGSSEWAADSCLAAWSEFEREWTGAPAPRHPSAHAPGATPVPPAVLVACVVLLALGSGTFAWSVFRTLFG